MVAQKTALRRRNFREVCWRTPWFKTVSNQLLTFSSPCLDYNAWILLRVLALHVSIANTARLLREFEFLAILEKTLGYLHKNAHPAKMNANGENEDESEGSLSDSEFSSDTVKNSADEPSNSKKRKRNGIEALSGGNNTQSSPESCSPVAKGDLLVVAICGVLKQLKLLTITPERSEDYTVEHLKAVLRCSPEKAASVLGSSLYMVNHILQTPKRNNISSRRGQSSAEPHGELKSQEYLACVNPIIEFWRLRASTIQLFPDEGSNVRADHSKRAHYVVLKLQQARIPFPLYVVMSPASTDLSK